VADTTIKHAMLPIVDCTKYVRSVRRIFQWIWRAADMVAQRPGPKDQTILHDAYDPIVTNSSMLHPTPHKTHPTPGGKTATPVIDLDDVKLTLGSQAAPVDILKGISLQIAPGETVGVLGPSGAGKTSLLMVMAGLESVTSGQINLAGTRITNMDEDQLAALRRDKVGIVFQAFRLIPSMTALQNVAIPLELAGHPNADQAAAAALTDVGLGHRLTHFPDQMSGGEQQRVAIARALAPRPRILLADEPTGNLDSATGDKVVDIMFDNARDAGAALVLVTHDVNLASRCHRIIRIEDGHITDDSQQ
jgi:putative ABC transport system ATP-binding protein